MKLPWARRISFLRDRRAFFPSGASAQTHEAATIQRQYFPTEKSESGLTLFGERHYRMSAGRGLGTMFTLAERLHSPDGREFFARQTTRSKLSWAELKVVIDSSEGRGFAPNWDLPSLLSATALNCAIEPGQGAFDLAARALRHVLEHHGSAPLREHGMLLRSALQISSLAGDAQLRKDLEPLAMKEPDPYSLIDLARPASWEQGSVEVDEWWRQINALFAEEHLEPWTLQLSGAESETGIFPAIHAAEGLSAERAPSHQPLISIIVPTYNPGPTFPNTVESLVRQSWQNIEILIVDDASTEGTGFIAEAAALDPRVQIITMPENGGAYRVRNAGIRAATGEFFTVLDADDLAHPRRLERQVQPLLDRDELVGTWSRAIRMSGQGRLTVLGSHAIRNNASSSMFRRELVVQAVGLYDEVRKAADSEFHERVQQRFGRRSVLTMPDLLGLIQMTEGSLSRNDFRGRWRHAYRLAYRNQYLGWHEYRLSEVGADPSPMQHGARAFVAPKPYTGLPVDAHIPIAFLSDWSHSAETRERLATTVAAIAEASTAPVGLLNGLHLKRSQATRENSSRTIWQLVEDGAATWMSWNQHTHIDTLVAPDPGFLALLPDASSIGLIPKRVVVVVDRLTSRSKGGGVFTSGVMNPRWIESQVVRAFGLLPHWLPATPYLRDILTDVDGEVLEPGTVRASPYSGSTAPESLVVPAEIRVLRKSSELGDLSPSIIWDATAAGELVVVPRTHRGTYGGAVMPIPRAVFDEGLASLRKDPDAIRSALADAQRYVAAQTSPEALTDVLRRIELSPPGRVAKFRDPATADAPGLPTS